MIRFGRLVGAAILVISLVPVPVLADEVGVVDPGTGQWFLQNTDGSTTTFYFGNPGDTPFAGDWDCDGIDTPGLYRQSDGYVYLRNRNTQGIADVSFFFGNPGDVPIGGDFNADGCDTVSIYRPSEQRFYIINALGTNDGGLGAADYSFVFGNPGDKPFVGDFNGNGQDTIGLHRESTGLVYFRNTNTEGIADTQFVFGDPGDRFIAGDWTEDGIDSPGLFRPSDATLYFRYTNTAGNADAVLPFGISTDLPIAGNWQPVGGVPSATGSGGVGDGVDKAFAGGAGGAVSDVGVPPDDGVGGGAQFSADYNFEPGSSAPAGYAMDATREAPPGPEATFPLGTSLDPTLPFLKEVGGTFDAQWCPDPNVSTDVWWGLDCPSQYVFSQNSEWLLYENLPYAVGQLVVDNGGTCSGTLVGKNVVLTAAHCVAGASFWEFIPDLYGGLGFGSLANVGNTGSTWFGTRAIYHAEFLAVNAPAFDYALVVFDANEFGQYIGDVYPWIDVYNLNATSKSLGRGYVAADGEYHMKGYPAEGWWAGFGTGTRVNAKYDAVPWWCGSTEGFKYNFGQGFYTLGFGCQTNGGSSGGPLFQKINGDLRLVSVVSSGTYVVACSYYSLPCGRYYGNNVWGPPLLNTTGPYGFDDLWWVAYNTALNGAICTGPCPG